MNNKPHIYTKETPLPIPPSLDLVSLGVNITEIINLRHALHEEPEIALGETKTVEKLILFLESKGANKEMFKRNIGETGMVLEITGTRVSEVPRRIIGLRADLDGLPIIEGCKDLPYRSKIEGVAHLCGHDGHMAMMCGAAWAFLNNRHKIPHTCAIRVIFEPAEETGAGSRLMIRDNVLEGMCSIYGMHGYGNKLGTICVHQGPFTTYLASIMIDIEGVSGHTSTPYKAKDPIPCASSYIYGTLFPCTSHTL